MGHATILSPNEADSVFRTVTLSGGAWLAEEDYRLANLLSDDMGLVARSHSLALDDTMFDVDLGEARAVFGVALAGGNLSRQAKWRVTAGEDATFAAWDYRSEWMDAFPVVFTPYSIPWEDEHRWDGKRTEEERRLFPQPLADLYETAVIARYWRIEIDDNEAEQTDGYVEFSRLFIAAGYIPSRDIDFDSEVALVDESVRQTTLGGRDIYDVRQVRRTATLSWPYLPEDEALSNLFDSQYRQGISKQIFVVWDPDDTVNFARRSFVATFEQLSAFRASQLTDHLGTVVQVREAI